MKDSMTALGMLELSSIGSLDAGFDDRTTFRSTQTITASGETT